LLLIFLPVHKGFTYPNDGSTGLCVKLCLVTVLLVQRHLLFSVRQAFDI